MTGRYSVSTIFKAIDRTTGPMRRMLRNATVASNRMKMQFDKLGRVAGKVSQKIGSLGRKMLVFGTIAAASLTKALGPGAEFEQAITDVGAVMLKTRSEIQPLEEQALRLGKTMVFTASQVANAQQQLAKAGFEMNEVLAATPGLLAATAASGQGLVEVSQVVASTLKGFRMDPAEAERVANVLALASSRSKSSILSLGESLQNVSSTAAQFFGKEGFEAVTTFVALLQDIGLDASVAGNAVNVMFTQLSVPNQKIQQFMRRANVSFRDLEGNLKGPREMLDAFNETLSTLTGNMDKAAFMFELVGMRGQRASIPLAELAKAGRFEELLTALEGATDEAHRMAALRLSTVKGSVTLLKSAFDGVLIKLFNSSRGPLKELIDRTTVRLLEEGPAIAERWGRGLAHFFSNFESNVEKAMTIAKLVGILWAVATAIEGVAGAIKIANFAFNLTPVGRTVTLILAAVTAAAGLVAWFQSRDDDSTPAGRRGRRSWRSVTADDRAEIRVRQSELSDSIFSAHLGARRGRRVDVQTGSSDSEETRVAELLIRDETGRGVVRRSTRNLGIKMQQSGAFQ